MAQRVAYHGGINLQYTTITLNRNANTIEIHSITMKTISKLIDWISKEIWGCQNDELKDANAHYQENVKTEV